MNAENSLRERKKRKVRESLVQEAVRLFQSRGYAETTVDHIVEAVEVSPRTFFRYFPTKEDVLFHDHAEYVATFQQELMNSDGRSTMAAMQHAAAVVARKIQGRRQDIIPRLRLVFSIPTLIAHNLQLDNQWLTVIADMIAARRGVQAEGDLTAQLTASAVVGTMWSTIRVWVMKNGRRNLEALSREAFEILRKGFR